MTVKSDITRRTMCAECFKALGPFKTEGLLGATTLSLVSCDYCARTLTPLEACFSRQVEDIDRAQASLEALEKVLPITRLEVGRHHGTLWAATHNNPVPEMKELYEALEEAVGELEVTDRSNDIKRYRAILAKFCRLMKPQG
jgi:hypothetical protein